jgi:hypothetical protein
MLGVRAGLALAGLVIAMLLAGCGSAANEGALAMPVWDHQQAGAG